MTAYVAENGHRPPMDHPQWWAFYGQVHRNRAPEFVALWESAPPAGSTHTIHFGLRGREYEVAVSREEAERIRAFLRPYVRAARPADPDRKPSPERPDSTRIGDHASMSGADGLVECLYCGHRARLLTPHLKHRHGVTAAEYRAEHNLPASASMMADADRARSSSKRRQMITEDPSRLDHLRQWHSPEHLKQMNAAAVEKVRASHQDETAREHRRPGRAYAAARMMEQRQRALAATVQSHGYDHVVDAIDKTRHLSTREAARLTGLGATTIARYRVRGDVGGAV
ncbi:Lsr2 dimerization domain-containing protein [Microbacterium hominis]|nr:histone-like nucleoid-structuring protein Lsr2 [Microbacterium hominis]